MEVRFLYITRPEKHACKRCLRACYVDGSSAASGHQVYLADTWPPATVHDQEAMTGFYHPNCRCVIELLGVEDDHGNVNIENSFRERNLSFPLTLSRMLRARMQGKEQALVEKLLLRRELDQQEIDLRQLTQVNPVTSQFNPAALYLGDDQSRQRLKGLTRRVIGGRPGKNRRMKPGETPDLLPGTVGRREALALQTRDTEQRRSRLQRLQAAWDRSDPNVPLPPGTPQRLTPTAAVRAFAESVGHQVVKVGGLLARLLGRSS